MPMVTLHKMGSGNVYHLHVLDAADPGYGQGGGPVDPGYGHGGGFPPDNTLPGGGHISNRPPGSGPSGIPDNTLPSGPPPHPTPGNVLIMVRDPAGVWHYASLPANAVPPPLPDNALPGQPPIAGQPLPPTAQPKR